MNWRKIKFGDEVFFWIKKIFNCLIFILWWLIIGLSLWVFDLFNKVFRFNGFYFENMDLYGVYILWYCLLNMNFIIVINLNYEELIFDKRYMEMIKVIIFICIIDIVFFVGISYCMYVYLSIDFYVCIYRINYLLIIIKILMVNIYFIIWFVIYIKKNILCIYLWVMKLNNEDDII